MVVCDQTDESATYINLFAKSNFEDVELNEDQLEAVAGGFDPANWAFEIGVKIVQWLLS